MLNHNQYPKRKDNLQIIELEGGRFIIFRNFYNFLEIDNIKLISLFSLIIEVIDGRTCIGDLEKSLSHEIHPDIFRSILEILASQNFIYFEDAPEGILKNSVSSALESFWENVNAFFEHQKEISFHSFQEKKFLIFVGDLSAYFLAQLLSRVPGAIVSTVFYNDFPPILKDMPKEKIISCNKIYADIEYDMAIMSPEIISLPPEKSLLYCDLKIVPSFLLSCHPQIESNADSIDHSDSKNFTGLDTISLKNAVNQILGAKCKSIYFPVASTGKERILPFPFRTSDADLFYHFLLRYFSNMEYGEFWAKVRGTFRIFDQQFDRMRFIEELLRVIAEYFVDMEGIPNGVGKARFFSLDMRDAKDHYFARIPIDRDFDSLVGAGNLVLRHIVGHCPNKVQLTDEVAKSILLGDKLGIIKSLSTNPPQSDNLPFFFSVARLCNTKVFTGRDAFSSSAGCHVDRSKAENAAIGEALERYCASIIPKMHKSEKRLNSENLYGDFDSIYYGSFKNLAYKRFSPNPSDFPLFSPAQYDRSGFPYAKFDENTVISWTWGCKLQEKMKEYDYRCSIAEHQTKFQISLLPAPMVYLPYKASKKILELEGGMDGGGYKAKEEIICPYSSVGLGCGKSIEEAILVGLYEVIERHALALLWLRKDVMPYLDIEWVRNRLSERDLGYILDPDANYRFLNLSGELGIPILWGFSLEKWNDRIIFACGSACRIDPIEALIKTVTEIAHNRIFMRNLILSETRKSYEYLLNYNNITSYKDHTLFYNIFPFMLEMNDFLFKGEIDRSLAELTASYTLEKGEILDKIVGILTLKKKRIYYSILTTSDVEMAGYCVVRILVPGFIYPSPIYGQEFLGCKELYMTGLEEEDLNILPHPFP